MITKDEKKEIIKRYAANPQDTGNTVVQAALLSKKIETIAAHLKSHKSDHSSRRGLLKLVGQRRALLGYLGRNDPPAAKKLRSDLDLG
ncbi:MAG: 30S ribosomal protein S15 [Elusimicrobia bacterium]|nr:30S ribosomal protein S15 [Elusimicrobiota bacterium]